LGEIGKETNVETKKGNFQKYYEDILGIIGRFVNQKETELGKEIATKTTEIADTANKEMYSGQEIDLDNFRQELTELIRQKEALKTKKAELKNLPKTATNPDKSAEPVLPASLKEKIAAYNATPTNELYLLSGLDLEPHKGSREIYNLTGEAKNLIDQITEQEINQIYFFEGSQIVNGERDFFLPLTKKGRAEHLVLINRGALNKSGLVLGGAFGLNNDLC
jgi:hypothetical protein